MKVETIIKLNVVLLLQRNASLNEAVNPNNKTL
jgi:hypothetical protein